MKKLVCFLMSVLILAAASGCKLLVKNDDTQHFDYPVTVGNIIFQKSPEKVAVLSDNLADIILACGYEGKLAAISDSCTREGLELLPSVGTPDSPDLNMIKDLGITLVLGDESFDPDTKSMIEEHGADVLIIKPAVNDDQLKNVYTNISAILGGNYTGKMKALNTIDSIGGELDSIKGEVSNDNVVATACYIYDIDGDQCHVSCDKDYSKQLFYYAQATNIAAEDDDGFVGIDTLLRGNPNVIFCDDLAFGKITENNDLKKLSAVTNGNVYKLPREYMSLQGKTRILTVDYMAAKSHDFYSQRLDWPEEFTEIVKPEYTPPFTPQEGIFYTVGESYTPVKDIEDRLKSLGYFEGECDINFTQETANAVSEFQNVNGLDVTGIADYETLNVLLSNDAVPADGEAVEYSAE